MLKASASNSIVHANLPLTHRICCGHTQVIRAYCSDLSYSAAPKAFYDCLHSRQSLQLEEALAPPASATTSYCL